MKIKIKGYLLFKNTIGEQILTLNDNEKITLWELLVRLSLGHELDNSLYHAEPRVVDSRVIVLVNGRNHSRLTNRLDTVLVDKDEIAIFPPMAGG